LSYSSSSSSVTQTVVAGGTTTVLESTLGPALGGTIQSALSLNITVFPRGSNGTVTLVVTVASGNHTAISVNAAVTVAAGVDPFTGKAVGALSPLHPMVRYNYTLPTNGPFSLFLVGRGHTAIVDPAVPVATSSTIRLVGGTNDAEGRVEVLINGTWGSVCHTAFGAVDAEVTCREAGYLGLAWCTAPTYLTWASYGRGTGPVYLENLGCIGNETMLLDCVHREPIGTGSCTHAQDVSVDCCPAISVNAVGTAASKAVQVGSVGVSAAGSNVTISVNGPLGVLYALGVHDRAPHASVGTLPRIDTEINVSTTQEITFPGDTVVWRVPVAAAAAVDIFAQVGCVGCSIRSIVR
jgi:hypothetical protein